MPKIRQEQAKRRTAKLETDAIPDRCDCCGNPPGESKGLCLDHCHSTTKFRGWLCHRCNLGIGLLGDSIEGIDKARAYLQRALAIDPPPTPSQRLAGIVAAVSKHKTNDA